MTLVELKLINEVVEDFYDTLYEDSYRAIIVMKARKIIKREIKLKEMDPRK